MKKNSLGDPLFVPQYLAMHSKQSILNRGPKIYNDVPMEIKLFNDPESFIYNLNFFIATICIIVLILCYIFLGETDVLEVFLFYTLCRNNS